MNTLNYEMTEDSLFLFFFKNSYLEFKLEDKLIKRQKNIKY